MDESDGRQGLPLLETPGAEMKKYYWPLILQGFVLGTVLAIEDIGFLKITYWILAILNPIFTIWYGDILERTRVPK
jgi:hypothetical protein